MRVDPIPMPDLLVALNQAEQADERVTMELSSGKSVNEPSDNPTAAALLIGNNDQTTFNAGYLQTLTSINGQLSNADSTLSSIQTALQRAISLGVQGANGTLSSSDEAAIIDQLQGIQSQVLELANTTYEGNYLFGGTVASTPPYTVSASDPSGVTYNGNTDVNQVSVGNGYLIQVNQPGSQLFSAQGNSVFLALNQLIQSLQSNTGVETAVTSLTSATNYLSAQTVFYGNAIDQVQSQTTYLNTAKLQLAQQQNTLGGVDLATAANQLAQDQTDTQAAIEAISRFSQMSSLFNYLGSG